MATINIDIDINDIIDKLSDADAAKLADALGTTRHIDQHLLYMAKIESLDTRLPPYLAELLEQLTGERFGI